MLTNQTFWQLEQNWCYEINTNYIPTGMCENVPKRDL